MGQLDGNTPYVIDYGHERKTATVELNTVGEVPKDVGANLSEPEEPPKIVEQAKEVVNQLHEGTAETAQK